MIRSWFACTLICFATAGVSARADDNLPPIVRTDRNLHYAGAETTCVAFSPNGKMVAAGGSPEGEIKLWEFPAANERATLHHGWHVAAVAFSPDGATMISAAWEQADAARSKSTIKVWSVATAQERSVLGTHEEAVSTMTLSPDGKLLASADLGGTVNVWSIEQGRRTLTFQAANGPVASLAFSPDGKTIAVGEGWIREGEPKGVTLYDPATGKEIRRLQGSKSKLGAKVAYSPKGDMLVGYAILALKVWNAVTGQEDGELEGVPHNNVASVAVSPDGILLAVGLAGGDAELWDLRTKKRKVILSGGSGQPVSVAFSPDGRTLVSTGSGVDVWNIPKVLQAKGATAIVH